MYRKILLSMIFLIVFASAFFGLAVTSAIDEPSPSPDAFSLTATSIIQTATANAQPSPDYAATATRIIAEATATANAYIDAGCSPLESTYWSVTLNLLPDNEGVDEENSFARNQRQRNNWLCDGQLALNHTEYQITLVFEGDVETTDFTNLLDDIVVWLTDYPPDNLPDTEALVLLSAYQRDAAPDDYFKVWFSWEFTYTQAIEAYEEGLRGVDLAEALGIRENQAIQEPSPSPDAFALTATSIIATATANARPSQTIDPFALTATSIIATATAQARPSQTIDPFALTATSIIATATAQARPTEEIGGFGGTATSIIQTATAQAQPSQTIDPFALTATSIIATATADAQSSQQFLPYPHTATAFAQTEAAIAIASPTYCQGFDWTFTYFAAEASYGIDAHEITRRYCTDSDFTLYSFEISIMDASGSLSDEDFYMLFESVIGSLAEFPDVYPIRKPDISEWILVTNFNTMETWEFTYTEAVNAWDEGLRGAELAEALGVVLP